MKSFATDVAKQFTAILLAALGAAAITFMTSIGGSTGLECTPITSPENAGILGAILKGTHSGFLMMKTNHLL